MASSPDDFPRHVDFSMGMDVVNKEYPPTDTSPDPILRPYQGVTPETNPWLEVWQRWDTLHYQAIAERG